MPRISKKTEALEAALAIIEAEGVHAVTYDALATATGISKSGLIYHFPSRHALLVDCHRFCAQRWEDELEALAGGKKAEELSEKERLPGTHLVLGQERSAHRAADEHSLTATRGRHGAMEWRRQALDARPSRK